MQKKTYEDLVAEIQELHIQLEEAQETLNAIKRGEIDGLVISTPKGEQVYTITGAEKPYRALIEDMREGAVMLSDDNTILYCNSGFAKILKLPMEKIVGALIESFVCPTHNKALKELLSLAKACKNSVTKEITLQSKDNVLVPTLISVNSLQSDTLKNTFLVVTDLSEHMEEEVKRYTIELELAQIALSESEQRWATTLASIGDAVIATDLFGKIKFMNGVAEKLTGWILVEASGRPTKEIFNIINEFTRKNVINPVTKVLEKGTIVGLANHTLLVRKDKTEIAIDDSGAPILSRDGKTTGVVLIFRDITERRKAEQALKQAQAKLQEYANNLERLVEERSKQLKDSERLATIGATAGMVGHDIRNPLQAIISDIYLAKCDLEKSSTCAEKESVLENLSEIEKNVDYINKIVADLQDYSKVLKPVVKEINVETLFNDVLLKNCLPKKIDAACIVDGQAKTIIADADLLKRIFTNLISNAVHAMPNGGKLALHAFKENGDTIITVQDTGVGIPDEIKPKLFTPLFTTRAKGQGFGLPVVKRMTEALGGEVTFESQEGKGTTFTVRLPFKKR